MTYLTIWKEKFLQETLNKIYFVYKETSINTGSSAGIYA